MSHETIYCSFCGKSNTEVRHTLTTNGGIRICDECVALAAKIFMDADATQGSTAPRVLIIYGYDDKSEIKVVRGEWHQEQLSELIVELQAWVDRESVDG